MPSPESKTRKAKPSAKALPPPSPWSTYHRKRKLTHLICFLVFVTLPFLNVMRFDIPKQRFYFAGYELWISEFSIIFFSLMFLMFLIAGMAMLYGRLFCSYLCPQMIFSEASLAMEAWLQKWITRRFLSWPSGRRVWLFRIAFYVLVGLASVFLAFVFISYFVEPRDLFWRLMSLDLWTAGGISGAVVTLITFLDFAFVRQRFCVTACPYGYLQGMLTDGNTLLVHYRDEGKDCIECKKCVRVCHMGIDIRDSPYQIECVHCGECIDACVEILGKVGKPGLIHYVWGEKGELLGQKAPWHRRLGLRDAKRAVVILILLFYLSGLTVALSMRKPVLVQVAPVRTTMYQVTPDGRIANHFRIRLANRSSRPAAVTLSIEGLPGAVISPSQDPRRLEPGQELQQEFDVVVTKSRAASEVNHFKVVARVTPEQSPDEFPMTFLMPVERAP